MQTTSFNQPVTKSFISKITTDLAAGIFHNDYPKGSIADRSYRRTSRHYRGGQILRMMRQQTTREAQAFAACLKRKLVLN